MVENIHALTVRTGTWQDTTELVGKLNSHEVPPTCARGRRRDGRDRAGADRSWWRGSHRDPRCQTSMSPSAVEISQGLAGGNLSGRHDQYPSPSTWSHPRWARVLERASVGRGHDRWTPRRDFSSAESSLARPVKWSEDDYDVLEGRRHRRPHLQGADRASRPPLDANERPQRHNGDIRRAAHGYEPTREAAMAAFKKRGAVKRRRRTGASSYGNTVKYAQSASRNLS